MPLKYNYHMHTELCGHAVGSIMDNINMAKSLGYKEIGFSEHAPLPLEAFSEYDNKRLYAYENMTMDIFEEKYKKPLIEYRNSHNDINIKIGLESEYLESYDSFYRNLYKECEYMILGLHFFEYEGHLIDTYCEIDNKTMYGYARCIEKALETGMFKILAHPDLYLYNDIKFDDDAKKVADIIIDAAIKNNVLVEINCNGNGKYPRRDFYEYIKNKKCVFVIGIDSHDPNRLSGEHIEESIKIARDFNLKLIENQEVAK